MTADPGALNTYYPTLLRYIGVAVGLVILMYGIYRLLRWAGVKHEPATGFTLVTPGSPAF